MPSRWRGRRPQSKFEVAADEDGRPDSMTTVCHSASQTSSQAVGCSRGRRCSLSVSFVVMLATKGAALLEEHSRTFGDRPCGCPRLRVSSNVFLLPYAGIQFPSGYPSSEQLSNVRSVISSFSFPGFFAPFFLLFSSTSDLGYSISVSLSLREDIGGQGGVQATARAKGGRARCRGG